MLAVLPGVLVRGERLRHGCRYLAGFVAIAGIPLAVLARKVERGSMSANEQYDLVVRIRHQHHQLYETFSAAEYRQTGLWLLVLCASLMVLRGETVARQVACVAAATTLIAGLGALASLAAYPRTLVMAQTARITPLIIVLAAAAAAAAACRLRQELAAPLLFLGLVVAADPRINSHLGVASAEAIAVLCALGLASIARGLTTWSIARAAHVAMIVSLGAAIAVVGGHERWAGSPSAHDRAWRDVARVAMRSSHPTDMFLVPPDQDGFRFYAHRPIVIDFGSFPFGRGLDEWRDRMIEVTGTRRVVDPDLGNTLRRVAFIADEYDATVRRSRAPVCRYHVKYVVARGSPHPDWLVPLYRNSEFTLDRVNAAACH
jgi:hypothetical protein